MHYPEIVHHNCAKVIWSFFNQRGMHSLHTILTHQKAIRIDVGFALTHKQQQNIFYNIYTQQINCKLWCTHEKKKRLFVHFAQNWIISGYDLGADSQYPCERRAKRREVRVYQTAKRIFIYFIQMNELEKDEEKRLLDNNWKLSCSRKTSSLRCCQPYPAMQRGRDRERGHRSPPLQFVPGKNANISLFCRFYIHTHTSHINIFSFCSLGSAKRMFAYLHCCCPRTSWRRRRGRSSTQVFNSRRSRIYLKTLNVLRTLFVVACNRLPSAENIIIWIGRQA